MSDHEKAREATRAESRGTRANYNRVPDELLDSAAWCAWRAEGGTKVPYAAPGRKTDVQNANPGLTFDAAVELAEEIHTDEAPAGIGFCFVGEPYVGIDLDAAADGDGEPKAWARPLVELAVKSGCYAENSPSGTGFHVIGFLDDDTEPHRRAPKRPGGDGEAVERFVHMGFFTVTGAALSGELDEIGNAAEVLAAAEELARTWGAESAEPTGEAEPAEPITPGDLDETKLAALLENVPKARATWNGERPDLPSASEHDLSLASYAAQVGWSDEEIGALIVAGRENRGEDVAKARRPDYLSRTVAKAREGTDEPTDDEDRGPPRRLTLRAILEDPDATKLPPAVVPRLVWPGRSTLLAAREKTGKSTAAAAAVTAVVTAGPFIDGYATRGRALVVALEEHVSDVARRLDELGAADDGAEDVFLVTAFDGEPVEQLAEDVAAVDPALVVVDTLAAFAAAYELDSGASTGWQALTQGLTDIAHDTGAGLLAVHHAKKSDGEYRDSTAIGAGVDVIAHLHQGDPKRLETERHLVVRGRFGRFSLWINYEDGTYVGGDGPGAPRPLHERILAYLRVNPGANTRSILKAVEGRAATVSEALKGLAEAGRIAARKAGRETTYFPPENPQP